MLGDTFYTLQVIAKYFFHTCGYKPKAVVKEVTDFFVVSNNSEYCKNITYWNDVVEDIVKKVHKYKPVEVDGVYITPKEIARIKELNNKMLEKLAFTLLCLAKFGNAKYEKNNNWVNTDYKEIFDLARVTSKKWDRFRKMHVLYAGGYFNVAKQVDNLSVQVNFIDDEITDDSFFIDDFRELGYEYLCRVYGENFIRCRECGILTRSNKNGTKKYCSKCAAYNPQNTKVIKCVDCGFEFKVSSKDNKTTRCSKCYDKYRKEYIVNKNRERRNCKK